MHVVNALFSRGLGGIEQAFVDYGRALTAEGHTVLQLCHPKAEVISHLKQHNLSYATLNNYGQWDIFAARRARKQLEDVKADITIAHGNRAISLLTPACRNRVPLVGVAHNYMIKRFARLDGALTVTNALRKQVIKTGLDERLVHHMPNMIDLPDPLPAPRKLTYPPVIGSIGRFVEKKGFDQMVHALNALHKQGMDFSAIIAGDGPTRPKIQALINQLGLKDKISLPGWIDNQERFYKQIKLFCLPSLHEPFGIVLLEAMTHGLPIVSTNTEGPSEILTQHLNAAIVPKGNYKAMADAMSELLQNAEVAQSMGKQAQDTVVQTYSLPRVAPRLSKALTSIRFLWEQSHAH